MCFLRKSDWICSRLPVGFWEKNEKALLLYEGKHWLLLVFFKMCVAFAFFYF